MLFAARRVSSGRTRLAFLPPVRHYKSRHWHTAEMTDTVNKTAHPFDKVRLDTLLARRFFYAPAFDIYGGADHLDYARVSYGEHCSRF